MRTAASTSACPQSAAITSTVESQSLLRSAIASRGSDYLILAKPRISVLVLLTVAAGYTLGSAGEWHSAPLLHAFWGVGLVAIGSCALNQFIERDTDALMRRTANRPLPGGRLHPWEVCAFGWACGSLGVAWLALAVNMTTAILSAATFILYTLAYTPLKRHTSLSTAVGAIPGAMPPVLGWTAAGGSLDSGAFSLFAILFLWQFPHFLAIAWIYREDYARAGLQMLPLGGRMPRVVGLLAVAYSVALLPFSLHPATNGLAGSVYLTVAVLLGIVYLVASVRFAWSENPGTARGLLLASLVYLPFLLVALVWDHLRLLA